MVAVPKAILGQLRRRPQTSASYNASVVFFNQSFGLQPAYLIEFVEQWKERGPDDRLLDSTDADAAWEFKKFVMGVDWRGPLRTVVPRMAGPSNRRPYFISCTPTRSRQS